MLRRKSDTKPQLQITELLIIRMTKAYITTICNNEMRNASINLQEKICSVQQNSHIKRPPLGVDGSEHVWRGGQPLGEVFKMLLPAGIAIVVESVFTYQIGLTWFFSP